MSAVPYSSHLPTELILAVLESVYYDMLATNRRALSLQFRRYSLVSKSWTLPSQRFLFQRVELVSPLGLQPFLSSISKSSAKGDYFASSVRMVHIFLGSLAMMLGAPSALTNLPNIYHLSIHIAGTISLLSAAIDQLRTIKAPTSLTLKVHANQSAILIPLLSLWPSVQHLRLDVPSTLPTMLFSIQQAAPRLYEFCCRADSIIDLLGLLSNSIGSLKVLEIASSGQYYEILEAHGPHLLSVRIHGAVPGLPLCSVLEELQCAFPPSDAYLTDVIVTHIRHFAFHTPRSHQHQSISHIIDFLRSVPQLECVTWTFAVQPPASQLKTIQKLCSKRQVVLIAQQLALPKFQFEDPVKIHQLPRIHSPSTLPSIHAATQQPPPPKPATSVQLTCLSCEVPK